MPFHALQVSFEKIYYTFTAEPDKFFWGRLKENTFGFVEKRLDHLDRKKTLCVHRPKLFTISVGPG